MHIIFEHGTSYSVTEARVHDFQSHFRWSSVRLSSRFSVRLSCFVVARNACVCAFVSTRRFCDRTSFWFFRCSINLCVSHNLTVREHTQQIQKKVSRPCLARCRALPLSCLALCRALPVSCLTCCRVIQSAWVSW